MRNPNGYGVWTDLDSGRQVELDTARCGHCQAHVFVKPNTAATVYLIHDASRPGGWREEPGAGCRVCMKPVCLACEAKGTCTPFEKRIEELEAKERLSRSVIKGDYR